MSQKEIEVQLDDANLKLDRIMNKQLNDSHITDVAMVANSAKIDTVTLKGQVEVNAVRLKGVEGNVVKLNKSTERMFQKVDNLRDSVADFYKKVTDSIVEIKTEFIEFQKETNEKIEGYVKIALTCIKIALTFSLLILGGLAAIYWDNRNSSIEMSQKSTDRLIEAIKLEIKNSNGKH